MVHRGDAQLQLLLAEIAGGGAKLSPPGSSNADDNRRLVSTSPDFEAEIRARLAARSSSALGKAAKAVDEHRQSIESVKQRLVGWREVPHSDIRGLAHDIETLRERLSASGFPGAEDDGWCGAKCPPRRTGNHDRISVRQRNVRSWEQRQLAAISVLVSVVDDLEAVSDRLNSDGINKPGRLIGTVKSARSAAACAERSFEAQDLVQTAIELAPCTTTTDPLLATVSSPAASSNIGASTPTRRGESCLPTPPPPPRSTDGLSPMRTVDWRQKQRQAAKHAAEQRKVAVAAADSADQLVASAVADAAAAALNAACRIMEQGLRKYDSLKEQQASAPRCHTSTAAGHDRDMCTLIRIENCKDVLNEALEAVVIATSAPLCADIAQCDTYPVVRQARLTLRKLAAEVARRDVALLEQDQKRKLNMPERTITEAELVELEQLQQQRLERATSSASGRGWGQFDPRAASNFELRSARTAAATGVYAAPAQYHAIEGRTAAALVLQRYVRGNQARYFRRTDEPQHGFTQQPRAQQLRAVPRDDGIQTARADMIGEHAQYWQELERLRCYQSAAMKYITTLGKAIVQNNAALQAIDAGIATGTQASANDRTIAAQKSAHFEQVRALCTDFAMRCNDTSESYMLDPDVTSLQQMECFLQGLVREPHPSSQSIEGEDVKE